MCVCSLYQDDISSVEERSRPGDDDRDLDVLDSEDNQGDENKEDTPQASGTPDQHLVTTGLPHSILLPNEAFVTKKSEQKNNSLHNLLFSHVFFFLHDTFCFTEFLLKSWIWMYFEVFVF